MAWRSSASAPAEEKRSFLYTGTLIPMEIEPTRFRVPLLLYGLLLTGGGLAAYLLGVLLTLPRKLLPPSAALAALNHGLVWYSSIPILLGILLVAADLAFL